MKKKLLKKKISLRTNQRKSLEQLKTCCCCPSLPVDAERKQLAVSSFAARVLFHFLVFILSFENCARCFCQLLCSRRTFENGRNAFYSKSSSSSSSSVFERQQIFPEFKSVLFVAASENEKTNTSERYGRVVFRYYSRWSSVGVVFGGGVIVFVCVLIMVSVAWIVGAASRLLILASNSSVGRYRAR